MTSSTALQILVPDIPGQCWSCHSCGECCRSLVGDLSDEERRRIDEQGWAGKLDVPPYVRIGRGWALNKHANNTCVFLDDQNHCRIHAEFGEGAKPFACRIFPFSVRPVAAGWQVSLRYDCPSVIRSRGEPVGGRRSWLRSLLGDLEHTPPPGDDVADLQRRVVATVEEVDVVRNAFSRWMGEGELTVAQRLMGAARITTTLADATLRDVRGSRLSELLEILLGALPGECASVPERMTKRQQGMTRQLAFAHVEHVTLAQRRAGWSRRMGMRWDQLRRSKRFRKGTGPVPELPGLAGGTTFEVVEAVVPSGDSREAVENLLLRYVSARLQSRSVFGQGYYGWPVFSGLSAFWLSLSVAGWLARYCAAIDERGTVSFDDIGVGLGLVDRGAARLPALGTVAERVRTSYFLMDDGLARALQHYTLLSEACEHDSK